MMVYFYMLFLFLLLRSIIFSIRLVFFFRSSYFSGGVFFGCAHVPGTLALDLPTLILERLVFLCLTV